MFQRILVPMDGSQAAECGLREAIRLAARLKASLVLLNVAGDFPLASSDAVSIDATVLDAHQRAGRDILGKGIAAAREAGVAAEMLVVEARGRTAWKAIVEQSVASRCDLIAMGTHGRQGMRRLALGSDAEEVLARATLPVLLVRAPVRAG